ncbi:MAG: type II secretion system protein [Patescibacteria group bacterium]
MKTKKIKKLGFTFIELLVVIAIMGFLSGVVLQSINSARTKSRNATRLAEVDQINKAFELSATGGANALPSTGGSYVCMGTVARTGCGGNVSPSINTLLENNLANKMIPYDPKFTSGVGANYLYHSNPPLPAGITTGPGSYLSWVAEDTVTPSCGRGQMATAGVTNGRQCFLRIGNAI